MVKQLMNYRFRPPLRKKWLRAGSEDARHVAALAGVTQREIIETARRSIYYGVEVELPGPTKGALLEAIGAVDASPSDFWYCKTDGSIPYTGVEMVSQPATERFHLHRFGWAALWERLESIPTFAGLYEDLWNACGMHVHVGRKDISPLASWRLLVLLNAFPELVQDMAGRRHNSWCQSLGRPVLDRLFACTAAEAGVYLHGVGIAGVVPEAFCATPVPRHFLNGRYAALNVQNRGTLELRIFAAPRSPGEFWTRMEAAFALTGFANAVPVNPDGETSVPQELALTQENFLAWVAAQRARFPHLVELLTAKGYLEKPLKMTAQGQIWLPFVDELQLTDAEILRDTPASRRRRH